MNRAERRRKDRELNKIQAQATAAIRKMSENELEQFLMRMLQDSAERLQEAVRGELRETFGFGDKRLAKLETGVQRRLSQ